jgi:hypothetical protein
MVLWFKTQYPEIPVVSLQASRWEKFPEANVSTFFSEDPATWLEKIASILKSSALATDEAARTTMLRWPEASPEISRPATSNSGSSFPVPPSLKFAPLNDHVRGLTTKQLKKPGSRHELAQGATRNNLVSSRFSNGQQTASRDLRIVLEQHWLREAPPHMPLRNSDKHVPRVLTILPR